MKKISIVLVTAAVLVAPAFAQAAFAQDKGPPTFRNDSEKKKDAEIDKAYRDAVRRNNLDIPKQTKADPWSDLRPAADNSKPDTVKK